MAPKVVLDLEELLEKLGAALPSLERIELFGSRRYRSGSLRSDIDLLLYFNGGSAPAHEVATVSRQISVYIDAFIVHDESLAISAINSSRIRGTAEKPTLAKVVESVEVWSRGSGFSGIEFRSQPALGEFVPVYSDAAVHGNQAAWRDPTDFVIVTAVDDEFSAVERALGRHIVETDMSISMLGRQVRARIPNTFGFEEVILCQAERMGNVAAALTASDALSRWAPKAMILVGIAGVSKTKVGDLVVADRVFDYESAKLTWFKRPHGLEFATAPDPRHRLLTWPQLDLALQEAKPGSPPPGEPQILSAGYASGEKVIANRFKARRIASRDRKIVALDMESLGFSDACRRADVDYLVIKAITDRADRRKSDNHRLYCCELVANLIVGLIQEGGALTT